VAKKIIAKFPLHGASTGKAKPSFEAEGFTGTACQSATEIFTNALGSAEAEELKPEFYDVEERHEHLQEGGDGPQST